MSIFTQCAGDCDLDRDKFDSDFVVFVNLQTRAAKAYQHRGELEFEHLTFYVVPTERANALYRKWLEYWRNRPTRAGGERKLGNMAVHVPELEMARYRDAWAGLRERAGR